MALDIDDYFMQQQQQQQQISKITKIADL